MYECQFDDLRFAEMKKYFPNALIEFERILKGMWLYEQKRINNI